MRKMLEEIEVFSNENRSYVEQTSFEDDLTEIYLDLLEFKQKHLPVTT